MGGCTVWGFTRSKLVMVASNRLVGVYIKLRGRISCGNDHLTLDAALVHDPVQA